MPRAGIPRRSLSLRVTALAFRLLLLSAAVVALALLAREAPAGSAAPVMTEGATIASDGASSSASPLAQPDLPDTDGDGIPDNEDPTPDHDIELLHAIGFGPTPITISDTVGRDMTVVGEVMNYRDHDETVAASLDVTGAPEGCVQTASFGVTETLEHCLEHEDIEVPDGETFTLLALESIWLCYHVRFECHDPAEPDIYPLGVTLCADHLVQQQIGYPPGVMDGDPLGPSCVDLIRLMLVVPPAPATPTPAPVGGIVELGDGTSALPPHRSGTAAPHHILLAALAATATAALTAGAWYTRRRWVR